MPTHHYSQPITDGAAGGAYTNDTQGLLASMLGGNPTLLTTSCTAALEMAAILADVGPGDEVIVPSFGFVTTALAFVRSGARVRFADIDSTTLSLDPAAVEAAVNSRTKAIVPIHYAGIPARMSELGEVAEQSQAIVIEDAAHGLGGAIGGRPLGTLAPLAALSFHASKNFSCGEGGALVVNDQRLLDRAHIVLEKGTDRRAFEEGTVDKYTWHDLGSSFGLSDFLAARLLDELKKAASIQANRRLIHETYERLLAPAKADLGFVTPVIPANVTPAYHLYYVILDDPAARPPLLRLMHARGVKASFHFVPLHSSPGGRRWGIATECPITDRIAASLIRLPMHHEMDESDAKRSATVFLECLQSMR